MSGAYLAVTRQGWVTRAACVTSVSENLANPCIEPIAPAQPFAVRSCQSFDDFGLRHLRLKVTAKWRSKMLETIAVVLVVLWLLGFVSSYTMGGFIHVLLILAVVVILIRVIQGRRL
jgi:hypothetical protein